MRKTPLLLALSVALLTGCAGGGGGEASFTLGGWERIEPGGETSCARGGPYAFWIRKGYPEKFLRFFEGGGSCFDETICAPGSRWFDDDVDASDDPAFADGILALENPTTQSPGTRSSSSHPAPATCTWERGP